MRVTVDDKLYLIEFQYGTQSVHGHPGREWTACLIRDGSAPSPGDGKTYPVIARAEVVCHYKDTPNRDTARKAALAKALYGFYGAAVKSQRRLFWEAYLNRKQGSARSAHK